MRRPKSRAQVTTLVAVFVVIAAAVVAVVGDVVAAVDTAVVVAMLLLPSSMSSSLLVALSLLLPLLPLRDASRRRRRPASLARHHCVPTGRPLKQQCIFYSRPDIESTELLVSYDASQKSLDLFGNNATDPEREEIDTSLAQTALDKATDAISVLVRRVSEVKRIEPDGGAVHEDFASLAWCE